MSDTQYEFYHYTPSLVAAIIFIALFFLISVLHAYQLVRTRTLAFIPFCIGGFMESVGYIGRAIGSNETPNWTLGPFVLQAVLILVAPALMAASLYMLLGRIITLTDGERHAFIKKRFLTKIFVAGDVFSFLLQAGGAGLLSAKSQSTSNTGSKIIMGGLVVQIVFFSVFVLVGVKFHLNMRRGSGGAAATTTTTTGNDKSNQSSTKSAVSWEKHLVTLYIGSSLILIRSIMRLIEYAQGNDGYLISHEVFLYTFDSVPMFFVMILFAITHPSEINAHLKGAGAKVIENIVQVYSLENVEARYTTLQEV
ncbi:uncharacterized protein PV06_03123 [Exophiala oligosperma]|uniref:RTA1 like protein n=1 Tax=Exophiala oligosperma TaxID=215243 RepID=A0A0D2DPB8_9EURO|nr:uncharacterized protein PV06_03123 [Exophiala oligosperma]KIW44668.1 hypothetical protein PV06_03123 [Exophiala oligosperma]